MNRRSFFKSMVGGIAATAAVRTWPFRVFSFPSEIKVARSMPMDPGFWNYEFAGIPIIEDTLMSVGEIFSLDNAYIMHPKTLRLPTTHPLILQQRRGSCLNFLNAH